MYENHFHGRLPASWNQSFGLAKHAGYRKEASHQKKPSAFAAPRDHGSSSMIILSVGNCSETCQQYGKH
jgi:hypothetical protein